MFNKREQDGIFFVECGNDIFHDVLRHHHDLRGDHHGERYRKTLPPQKRTPDEPYEQRLQACKHCKELESGTCKQCGCYVEMRAARKDMHCPRKGGW